MTTAAAPKTRGQRKSPVKARGRGASRASGRGGGRAAAHAVETVTPAQGDRSDDDDDEKNPVEEHVILRMPPDAAATAELRALVESRAPLDKVKLTFNDDRRGVLQINNTKMRTTLVDLPCIVESQKTFDNKQFYKIADIAQMIVCEDLPPVKDGTPLARIETIDPQLYTAWPDGLTRPLRRVRQRRFRVRAENKAAEKIEEAVENLLRADFMAEETQCEEVVFDAQGRIVQSQRADPVMGERAITPAGRRSAARMKQIQQQKQAAAAAAASSGAGAAGTGAVVGAAPPPGQSAMDEDDSASHMSSILPPPPRPGGSYPGAGAGAGADWDDIAGELERDLEHAPHDDDASMISSQMTGVTGSKRPLETSDEDEDATSEDDEDSQSQAAQDDGMSQFSRATTTGASSMLPGGLPQIRTHRPRDSSDSDDTSSDESSEEEDEDDEDDLEERSRLLASEVAALKARVAETEARMTATTNPVLKRRLEDALRKLQAELEFKTSQVAGLQHQQQGGMAASGIASAPPTADHGDDDDEESASYESDDDQDVDDTTSVPML